MQRWTLGLNFPMSSTKPILIIGAGISGLTLAQGLLKENIPFHLFERDAALNLRSQGYRVRISDPGIIALKQNLSPALFSRLLDSCCEQESRTMLPSARLDALTEDEISDGPLIGKSDNKNPPTQPQPLQFAPLNADRSAIRNVLFTGLENHTTFGKDFSHYTTTSDNIISAHFIDGTSVSGSLLVGADGTWSRIRHQLLPSYTLLDTEGRLIYGKTPLTHTVLAQFSKRASIGLSLVCEIPNSSSANKSSLRLLLEPMRFNNTPLTSALPEDYIYWVLFLRKGSLNLSDTTLLNLSSDDAADLVQQATTHWHKAFRVLFEEQDRKQTACLRVVSARPEIPNWSEERVTLIGDAIHPMAPTAAAGATTALRDAGTLAHSLSKNIGGNVVTGTREYEGLMREYASEAVQMTVMGGRFMFGMKEFQEMESIEIR